MQDRKLKPKPKPPKPTTDQLEVRKTVQPPPINETIEKAQAALTQAKKRVRLHRCRQCHHPNCPHFEQEDIETGEQFDLDDAPDLDGNRRPNAKKA
jgi:hypothetical protein